MTVPQPIKIKLVKLNHISSTISEKNIRVKVGDINEGFMTFFPVLGIPFDLDQGQLIFRTTDVQEIIDDRTFKTKNSIYKIVTLEDEREERIKILFD
jgi:hypothetical protein